MRKGAAMEHDQIAARQAASALMANHAGIISAAIYQYGQGQTVRALHELANLIESSEFTTRTEWLH